MSDLYERLRKRRRPSLPYHLLDVSPEELVKAQERVTEAEKRHRLAVNRENPAKPETVKELSTAKRALTAAVKRLEGCWQTFTLTAMEPDRYEKLKAAHPPTAEQVEAGDEWNRVTLRPALLEECTEGMTAAQWAEVLATSFAEGERQEIFTTALAINQGARVVESTVLPKDWTTRS